LAIFVVRLKDAPQDAHGKPKLKKMTLPEYIKSVREKIARNDLSGALRQLRALLDNAQQLDEVLLQSARFHAIRQQIRLGTVSHAEANLTQNQIRVGLLELVSEIEQSVGATSSRPDTAALRAEVEHAVSIVNSKNVVVGSTITAGGDVQIGDKNTTITQNADKIYNINHIDNANFS
jgi:Effector-associated domain 11